MINPKVNEISKFITDIKDYKEILKQLHDDCNFILNNAIRNGKLSKGILPCKLSNLLISEFCELISALESNKKIALIDRTIKKAGDFKNHIKDTDFDEMADMFLIVGVFNYHNEIWDFSSDEFKKHLDRSYSKFEQFLHIQSYDYFLNNIFRNLLVNSSDSMSDVSDKMAICFIVLSGLINQSPKDNMSIGLSMAEHIQLKSNYNAIR